jgi:hypothetical protein
MAAVDDFCEQWTEWGLSPFDRDENFLRDYKGLLRHLSELASLGRPLRYVLQESVNSEATLTLGAWSCTLSSNWKTRCSWQESPSDWAEFLSSIKYGTNTRAIKERLTRANFEQTVRQAWGRYGVWLRANLAAVADLEKALDGLQIELCVDVCTEASP